LKAVGVEKWAEEEALQAVRIMRSKLVIPCHYNCPAFFKKNIILLMVRCLKKK